MSSSSLAGGLQLTIIDCKMGSPWQQASSGPDLLAPQRTRWGEPRRSAGQSPASLCLGRLDLEPQSQIPVTAAILINLRCLSPSHDMRRHLKDDGTILQQIGRRGGKD